MVWKRLFAGALLAGLAAGLAGCYEPAAYGGHYAPDYTAYWGGPYYHDGRYWCYGFQYRCDGGGGSYRGTYYHGSGY